MIIFIHIPSIFLNSNSHKIYSSESISEEGLFNQIKIPSYLLFPSYTINFYDSKKNKLKGSFNKSLEQLKYQKTNKNLQIKMPISKTISLFVYDNSEFIENISIYDFISAGIRIKLSIGIDFTGSNGHPFDEGSLHSINTNNPNDYEKVIKIVGNILSNYNNEQLFPVYGFGAILENSSDNQASMCFNINFQNNPEIHTINNVINVYHQSLTKLTFAGPTFFTPILKKVIEQIKKKNNNLEYNILMILTDGTIDDLEDTIDNLVEGSFEPLSVIIVGIGQADFSQMVILDSNEEPLINSKNKKWMRDIVQFIQFNNFKNDEQRLAKEILEEFPRQIIEYYSLNNYTPEKIRNMIRGINNNFNNIYNYNNNNYNNNNNNFNNNNYNNNYNNNCSNNCNNNYNNNCNNNNNFNNNNFNNNNFNNNLGHNLNNEDLPTKSQVLLQQEITNNKVINNNNYNNIFNNKKPTNTESYADFFLLKD